MGVRKKGVRLFLCLVIVFVICLFPVVAVTGCHREPPTLTQYVGWLGSEAKKRSTVSPCLEITKPIDPSSMFPVMLHWGQVTAVILAPLLCPHVSISLELSGWWSCFLFGRGLVVTPLRHGAAPLWICVCADMVLGGGEAIWACSFSAPHPGPAACQPSDEHTVTVPPVGA